MNLTDIVIREILSRCKTVAIVGVSREPSKDSHRVAEYLKNHGFHVISINPFVDKLLGERAYKSLLDVPQEVQKTIEIVDIFRPSEDVPQIVEQAIQLRRKYGKLYVVWMQFGIINMQAAKMAEEAGLTVVMDHCMMAEHKRMPNSPI